MPPGVRSSGHQSAFKIILAVFAIMVAALLGLIVLLLIGAETGPVELVIGLTCATTATSRNRCGCWPRLSFGARWSRFSSL